MIPLPASVTSGATGHTLSDGMVVVAGTECRDVGSLLVAELSAATGWHVFLASEGTSPHGTVRLSVQASGTGAPGQGGDEARAQGGDGLPGTAAESYRLAVGPACIEIEAPSPAGVFYGTRTLRQLLPADLFRRAPVPDKHGPVTVEGTVVQDGPLFAWRGLGIDVSRHFFPKEFLLRLVDLASMHKLNVLHLHLTDDQGWRVESDRYPLLTEVGAWRSESPAGHYREHRKDGAPHGGYYTKADLAEVVSYAARRFMTVVPEVDMPGHMQAAIAAYPELGNDPGPLEVYTDWGISDHVLNMEASTVEFCANVLAEVMEIFPGPYVHIGGDECPTTEWEASARARELATKRGLTGPEQLQGWFTAQVAEVARSRGKTLIGWDEVLDAGAPPGALIMVWRNEHARRAAVQAAEEGHDVVMAPEQWTYFDWSYADSPCEPVAIRPAISVEQAYSFRPVPDGLAPDLEHRVLGAQCQLWTEYVATREHAEYMYFPRLCAFAEVVWSGPGGSWGDFEPRLRSHLDALRAMGVNFRPLEGPTPGQARCWDRATRPA